MNVYIVSYLGEEEKIINKRLDYHNRQLDWFIKNSSDSVKIKIFDQNYEDSWKRHHPRIEYYSYRGKVLRQWEVRNIFYDEFYGSDNPIGVFADNDAALYDHFDGPQFLNFIENFSDTIIDRQLHCIVPIDPGKSPFNKVVADNKTAYDLNYIFKRTNVARTAFYSLVNLKLIGKDPIYFRNFHENCQHLSSADDFLFSYDFIRSYLRIYRSYNFILKDMVGEKYSLLAKNNEERRELIKNTIDQIASEEGISMDRSGVNRHLRKKYGNYPNVSINKNRVENIFF